MSAITSQTLSGSVPTQTYSTGAAKINETDAESSDTSASAPKDSIQISEEAYALLNSDNEEPAGGGENQEQADETGDVQEAGTEDAAGALTGGETSSTGTSLEEQIEELEAQIEELGFWVWQWLEKNLEVIYKIQRENSMKKFIQVILIFLSFCCFGLGAAYAEHGLFINKFTLVSKKRINLDKFL